MSAWKQFLASDIIVTPFTVNKGFDFPYSQWATGSDGQLVGIDTFIGKNVNWFSDKSTTGTLSTEYQALIYQSAKQLYYSNFLSSSTGDNVAQPVLFPGSNPSGDVLIGGVESPLYDNFLPSTLIPTRFFPTASGDTIGIISIPSKLYGDYIVPNTFRFTSASVSLIDDGEGNIIVEANGSNFGNIIYGQGIIILTNSASYAEGSGGGATFEGYGFDEYGVSVYGAGDAVPSITSFLTSTNVTCSFSSSITIYETQYKCTIRESEFNSTLNPSARDSDGNLNSNVTGSFFSPYVTTVGLYDELQNLLAVGKLAQPLPTSNTTDLTILVNIDK
jgi:hypothetical protein